VAADIHLAQTGQTLAPDKIVDGFYYPLYFVLVLAPLTFFSYDTLLPWLYVGGFLLLMVAFFSWCRLFEKERLAVPTAGLVLVGIGSLPAIEAITVQQPVIVSVVGVAAGCAALAQTRHTTQVSPWYTIAGCLFAVATIKPQCVAILLPLLVCWVVGNIGERYKLILGFTGGMGLLLLGAQALDPDWIPKWMAYLANYSTQTNVSALLLALLPPAIEPIVLVVVGAGLAIFAWRVRHVPVDHIGFQLLVAISLLGSYLLFPSWLYQQLLLYPAMLLLVCYRSVLIAYGRMGRWLYSLVITLVFWPFLVGTIGSLLWIGGKVASFSSLLDASLALQPILLLPIVVLPLILLLPLGFLVHYALGHSIAPTNSQHPAVGKVALE
jgi:hypothetical protein